MNSGDPETGGLRSRLSRIPFAELMRYACVGLAVNLAGYLIYLLVTALWLSPLTAVSIFYPLSVLVGYFAHRRHTFRHHSRGLEGGMLVRYLAVYAVGYLINIGLLEFFYVRLGYAHQLVQGAAILIVAGFLFLAMKVFVFNKREVVNSRAL